MEPRSVQSNIALLPPGTLVVVWHVFATILSVCWNSCSVTASSKPQKIARRTNRLKNLKPIEAIIGINLPAWRDFTPTNIPLNIRVGSFYRICGGFFFAHHSEMHLLCNWECIFKMAAYNYVDALNQRELHTQMKSSARKNSCRHRSYQFKNDDSHSLPRKHNFNVCAHFTSWLELKNEMKFIDVFSDFYYFEMCGLLSTNHLRIYGNTKLSILSCMHLVKRNPTSHRSFVFLDASLQLFNPSTNGCFISSGRRTLNCFMAAS